MPKLVTPLLTVDAVILFDKDKLILIRRKNPPFQGQYALPGGFVDIGETVEDACVRETLEETNVNVNIERLIGIYSDPKRDPRGHVVTIAYLCETLTDNEKPKAQDDASALEIIPISKVPSLKLAFDHMEIIKDSGILSKIDKI